MNIVDMTDIRHNLSEVFKALCDGSLELKDIPQQLIEAKRDYIKTQRKRRINMGNEMNYLKSIVVSGYFLLSVFIICLFSVISSLRFLFIVIAIILMVKLHGSFY